MASPLHVLVIGGGIGGLALAQGLRRAGVGVAVYERDRTRADWVHGFRIHIDSTGSRALHDCLPPALWDAFRAVAGVPPAGLAFLTEQMRELIFVELPGSPDPTAGHHPVSRVKLRQVLLAGLDDVVQFDKAFVRFEGTAEGRITAYFADGTSATGDVLVGADGVGSKVRQQYLPGSKVVDTGVIGLSGKLPLTDPNREALPQQFTNRLNLIMPPRGCGMFVAQFIQLPKGTTRVDHGELDRLYPGLLDDNLPNHVFWAFLARRENCGDNGALGRLDGADLQRLTLRMIDGWHPDLRRLVAESDPLTVASIPLQTSVPIPPWQATSVTLLGDAIHTMTPLQGLGGNTALRDATLLCHKLIEVAHGESALLPAIGAYEAGMVDYGFAAVRRSLQMAEQTVSDSTVRRAAFRTMLRTAATVPPLRRLMFQDGR